MKLADQLIVVTGASSGLGKAMARAFADEGATVVCAARTEDTLRNTVQEISDDGVTGDAVAVTTDVRSQSSVENLINWTRDAYGEIDTLVNNAAVRQYHLEMPGEGVERPIADVSIKAWDAVLETNVRGVILCTKAVLPSMLRRGVGRVIHISSSHGRRARPNRGPYVVSKFGMEGFHETLALELEDTGVDSIALRPPGGGVHTEYKERAGFKADNAAHTDPSVISRTSVRIAAGDGENGGRYEATPDGAYESYASE
ncbi:SDR family NAD(P)-dependent oxidoreductase [Saliphagus sp. GCM10025334]